jgi:hypothetical protein
MVGSRFLRPRFGFRAKAGAALLLVWLGDRLFFVNEEFGSAIGAFALAWAVGTLLLQPALRHDRRGLSTVLLAAGYAVILVDDPSLLGWLLFWTALAMAALLPRTAKFDNALQWAVRLIVHGATSLFAPVFDARKLARAGGRTTDRPALAAHAPVLILPILGGIVFVALFAIANPLIGNALAAIELPSIADISILRAMLWIALLTLVWSSLRPRRFRILFPAFESGQVRSLPGVTVASVTLSLLLFNALFALQNGLDLAFLWSGAPLPADVTLADYAHRGAYPLIATALLAGLFVLVTLRPGSDTASVPLIRRLVVLWIAQNIFLVASSMLRTIDYVEAYSLTRLRIAALAWMLLVAVGLFLICWRMLRGRSTSWLINGNALAATVLLTLASVIDLGSVAAAWNVRHAREVDGSGAGLDLCYLNGLGASALVSLVELEQRPLAPRLKDRVSFVREQVLQRTLADHYGGWWTWRNQRRIDRAMRLQAGKLWPKATTPEGWLRDDCGGGLIAPPPPPPAPAPTPPLPEIRSPSARPLTPPRQQ